MRIFFFCTFFGFILFTKIYQKQGKIFEKESRIKLGNEENEGNKGREINNKEVYECFCLETRIIHIHNDRINNQF